MGSGPNGREEAISRRSANERVRAVIDCVGDERDAQGLLFFCECGDPACGALVRLSVCAFDALAGAGDPVLAEGHLRVRPLKSRVRFAATMSASELSEAGDDVERLLDYCDDLDVTPAARTLLAALDEAITDAASISALD